MAEFHFSTPYILGGVADVSVAQPSRLRVAGSSPSSECGDKMSPELPCLPSPFIGRLKPHLAINNWTINSHPLSCPVQPFSR